MWFKYKNLEIFFNISNYICVLGDCRVFFFTS